MLDVNLGQVYHSVRACMRDLVEHAGAMVNVSSVHAHVGFDGHAGYDATKGAMCALTRELAVEFGPQVRVNAVLPGPIITGIWDDVDEAGRAASAAMTTLARNGQPEEVAAAIAFLRLGRRVLRDRGRARGRRRLERHQAHARATRRPLGLSRRCPSRTRSWCARCARAGCRCTRRASTSA